MDCKVQKCVTFAESRLARPRAFDEDAALERALRVFWAKGYAAASLDELCGATGLARSSLYAAFRDKRGLYLRALDRYEEASAQRLNAILTRPVPLRQAIEQFVQAIIDEIVAGPGRRGCFIGNCAAELDRSDRQTAASVRRSLARIESAFRDALTRAAARGELPEAVEPAATARFLTAGMQGLRLVGKANPDAAALRDVAAVMLRCLDA